MLIQAGLHHPNGRQATCGNKPGRPAEGLGEHDISKLLHSKDRCASRDGEAGTRSQCMPGPGQLYYLKGLRV
ncbi:hypothetical protein DPEC_G00211260 [Dallia pectoralis]|uniref:Uncharacterized protein n=1 Tax=Dallia pectoralis TaxID=75939 RepID=A0ACC2G672_DALPE|nr:hypothetical protein DPEC_G00211260 [Dallia pectoralis]